MGGKKGGKKSSKKSKKKTPAQKAAAKRHAKFKQTRVQTFGGKKTNFTKAEKARIEAAGYSVAGYSKAAPKSDTQIQVDKDNAMYGNTVPSGSFGISEEGKRIAAAQLQEKRMADKELARITARNPEMAKYYASLPPGVRNDALIGGRTQAPGVELGIGLGTIIGGKMLLGGGLASLGIGGTSKGLGFKGAQAGFTGMGKKGFDAISAGAKYKPGTFNLFGKTFNKPQILGGGKAYSSPKAARGPFYNPGAGNYAGTQGSLGGTQTPGGVISSIVPKGAPRIGFLEKQAAVRPGTFDKGVQLANKLQQGAYGKSTLANTLRNQLNIGVAPGGGIGSNLGANLSRAGMLTAGGLNLSGGVDSGDAEASGTGSGTGRTVVTTDRDKNISYDVGGIAKDIGLGLADAFTGNKFDFDGLGRPSDDKTPSQKFETFKKSPLQQAILSKQLGIDANRIINEGGPAADSLMKNYISQIDSSSAKGIRNPIARLFRDTSGENQTDATAMAGRAMSAFSVDDPNFSNDPNKLTKLLKFAGVPQLSEENVQDIRHTFNKDVTEDTGIPGKGLTNIPYTQALGLANRITSGKIKDGVEESMNQLNMKSVPTLDDAVALGSQFKTNMETEGTVTKKRMDELDALYKKYGPGGGQAPTIPSIIKGIGGARRTSGSGNNLTISGSNNMTATIPDAITPEILPLPTTVAQGGTNATDLASIQQQAYNNQLSLYGMNPNYFANIMQPRFNTRPRKFRHIFNRGYF